ncbi:MAG TPA: TrmH family RNA methyltransferase, partial [Clostridia bacterium]|nr:TrmH family RNA methyltransferase [Clostridia bacterium]
YLKRSGLDYWHLVDIRYHDSIYELLDAEKDIQFFFASTKGGKIYTQAEYPDGSFLVFGKETRGLDEGLLAAHYDSCIRIPMINDARSLNLSNSVAVILYEALRQQGFRGLKIKGELTKDAFNSVDGASVL